MCCFLPEPVTDTYPKTRQYSAGVTRAGNGWSASAADHASIRSAAAAGKTIGGVRLQVIEPYPKGSGRAGKRPPRVRHWRGAFRRLVRVTGTSSGARQHHTADVTRPREQVTRTYACSPAPGMRHDLKKPMACPMRFIDMGRRAIYARRRRRVYAYVHPVWVVQGASARGHPDVQDDESSHSQRLSSSMPCSGERG